ncbi:hypothetical protein N0V94_003873 [Neodidymelliopsis sp. IMI 364377]|nr:hypothetical protein N0V94_003873 [Neodidymelliopsis sp. IMI 364377]
MDESYKSFKNSYLDLMAQIHESTEREQKLLNGNKELERKLAVIEVELVAERDKVKVTAREAAEWKAKNSHNMSFLKYNNPPGASQKFSDQGHYSQTVDLGNGTIKCAGQGGWNPQSGELDATDSPKQVQLAIENVDLILKEAGLRGWEDVYLLRSYHTDIGSTWELAAEALKRRIPSHRPVWTAVGVASLAFPAMLIELDVEAKRQE